MKSILALLDISLPNGMTALHQVIQEINSLLQLHEATFQIGNSSTRDSLDGGLMDLRTTRPLDSRSPETVRIRNILNTMFCNEILKFEEKKHLESGSITFIITAVDEEALTHQTPENLLVKKEYVKHLTVQARTRFTVKSSYIRMIKNEEVLEQVIEITNQSAPSHQSTENKQLVPISHLLIDMDFFHLVKTTINEYFGFDYRNGFQYYQSSSYIQSPYDIRLFIHKEHLEAPTIRKCLGGFSLNNVLVFEEKNIKEHVDTVFIIKEINFDALAAASRLKKEVEASRQTFSIIEPELQTIIALLQELAPGNSIFHDLQCLNGSNSTAYPYPHIRSREFHSKKEKGSEFAQIVQLFASLSPIITFSFRRELLDKAVPRGGYFTTSFRPTSERFQAIFDVVQSGKAADNANPTPQMMLPERLGQLKNKLKQMIVDKQECIALKIQENKKQEQIPINTPHFFITPPPLENTPGVNAHSFRLNGF